jgi:toxin FitB
VRTVLDTNVLSELLRQRPAAGVLGWFAAQSGEDLFVSAVTQAEMLYGAAMLPAGKRRAALQAALRAMFDEDFADRVLPFDCHAAPAYATIVAARRAAGRPIAQFDAQTAAIAHHHGARLATRDVADFDGCGVELVDPWASAA